MSSEPHAFWSLAPDHPLRADGTPQARNVGLYHIEYGESIHEEDGTVVPSYNIHDAACSCQAHCHSETIAVLVALALSLVVDGGNDLLILEYRRRGWLR